MPVVDYGALVAGVAFPRSSHWPTVERAYLTANPDCAACTIRGAFIIPNVHHIHPFHDCIQAGRPDLEFDFRNLISLCRDEVTSHHLLLGHLDEWASWNAMVVEDCQTFHGMTAAAIRADSRWQSREKGRPVAQMPHEELVAFRQMLDAQLPPDPAILGKYSLTLATLS